MCNIPEATHRLFYCMMVKIASSGKAIKVRKVHFLCSGAARNLGFEEPDDCEQSAYECVETGIYKSWEKAYEVRKEMPHIECGEIWNQI